MATTKTIKKRYVEHISKMDLKSMSVYDLSTYADIIGKLASMEKPDITETLAKVCGGFNAPYVAPAEKKEVD